MISCAALIPFGAPGRLSRALACVAALGGLLLAGTATPVNAAGAGDTLGPNACGECHKEETKAWKTTHHFKTYRAMPRRGRAKTIAKKMGIRRIKAKSMCLGCHFTVSEKENKQRPVAGISCESCHGSGREWIKIHSGYSGKTAKTESKAEAQKRWQQAEAKGMIRPGSLYRLAKNCYSCHVVPNETLVNKGGHRAGSPFELLSWSQGEVRHTTWHSKGKSNLPAKPDRKRMLYLVGLGVELETSLRAVAKATSRKVYAFQMARRVDQARRRVAAAAKALPNVPEIARLVEYAYSTGLKIGNQGALNAAADNVSKVVSTISKKYDGGKLTGIDGLMPGPDKYKGRARLPALAN